MMLAAATLVVLSGFVRDRTTAQPLAHVTVSAGTSHATTDAAGHYALRGLRKGSVTIELESDDVPPQRFTFDLIRSPSQHDFTACSTTLDYSCSAGSP